MEQVPGSRAVSQNDGITVPVNHNMRTVTSLEILTPYQVPTCGLQNANRGNPQTGQYQQGSQQTFQRPFQCSFLLYAGIPSTLLDENRRVLFHAKKNFSIKMPRDCWDSLSWDNFLGIWSPDRYYIRSIYKVFPSMRVLLCFVSHLALILSRIYTTGCDGPCSPCVCPYPHCHEWRCIGRRIGRPFPNVQWVSAQAVKRIWSIHHPHRTSDWVSSVQRRTASVFSFGIQVFSLPFGALWA